MSAAKILTDLNSKVSPDIDGCIEDALQIVQTDVTLRPPKTANERQNGFAAWLAKEQAKFWPAIEQAIAQRLSVVPASDIVQQVYVQQVQVEVEKLLRTFALRYYAGLWVSKRMGDAVFLQAPEPQGDYWCVSLGVVNYQESVGQVILDSEGHIIEEQSTTRQQLLERLHGQPFSPSETTARK